MSKARLTARLEREYGRVPDVEYFPGDMEAIRSYYDGLRAAGEDGFYVDDITWNDLNMDEVFRRINPGLSTSGEQCLYRMLRRPLFDGAAHRERMELTRLMEEEKQTRLRLQTLLNGLGNHRHVDIVGAFSEEKRRSPWLFLYIFCALLIPAALALLAFHSAAGFIALLVVMTLNGMLHEYRVSRCEREFRSVNYSVGLAATLKRVRRMNHPLLNRRLSGVYPQLDRLRPLLRVGFISTSSHSDLMGILNAVLLTDLIACEALKNRLIRHRDALLCVHEAIGQLDAAIAVASLRQSLEAVCEPNIDFDADRPFIQIQGARHLLIAHSVPNDLSLDAPLLITGANASGKSTFLKAVALCALLAQSLGLCPADSYRAGALRVFSSMAISDDILSGDSYYMAEIKSVRRILAAPPDAAPVLCVIDELLRGTNTVERIAASAEILDALRRRGALCVVATHDRELCDILRDGYALAHFDQQVTERDIVFDYRLRPGPAVSRNAIDLLHLVGFDQEIVSAAHRRADEYANTGVWRSATGGGR